jgi:recombinational DNA repair protein (RecF pathway)
MTIRCAKCGKVPQGDLTLKTGKLLCSPCAEPPKVPIHRRAYIAELALRRKQDAFAKATEACKEFERLFGVTVDEFHQFRSRDVYELLSAQRSQEPADDE